MKSVPLNTCHVAHLQAEPEGAAELVACSMAAHTQLAALCFKLTDLQQTLTTQAGKEVVKGGGCQDYACTNEKSVRRVMQSTAPEHADELTEGTKCAAACISLNDLYILGFRLPSPHAPYMHSIADFTFISACSACLPTSDIGGLPALAVRHLMLGIRLAGSRAAPAASDVPLVLQCIDNHAAGCQAVNEEFERCGCVGGSALLCNLEECTNR